MHITPIGFVTLALILLTFLVGRKWLWLLVIMTLPLQSAAAVTFSAGDRETGLNPRFVVMLVACAACLPSLISKTRRPSLTFGLPLVLFCSWSLISALIIPIAMAGKLLVLAYNPGNILKDLGRQPNNLRHSIYLTICCLSCYCLASDIVSFPLTFRRKVIKTFEYSAWFAIFTIVWQMGYFYLGLPFPAGFFQNNPGAAINATGALRPDIANRSAFSRPSGTFSEPSFAAMYVVGFFAFVLACYLYGRRPWWRGFCVVVLVFVNVGLTSTSGFFAAGAVVAGFAVCSLGSWRNAGSPTLRLVQAAAAVLLISSAILAVAPRFRDELWTLYNLMVNNKISTDAGGRQYMESNAIRVFWETYGVGAGLGSNLSNTIWGYTLSNMGVVGAVLLMWFGLRVWLITRHAIRYSPEWGLSVRAIRAFVLGLLVVAIIGVEALVEPSMWVIFGLLVGISIAAKRDSAQMFGADPQVFKLVAHPHQQEHLFSNRTPVRLEVNRRHYLKNRA